MLRVSAAGPAPAPTHTSPRRSASRTRPPAPTPVAAAPNSPPAAAAPNSPRRSLPLPQLLLDGCSPRRRSRRRPEASARAGSATSSAQGRARQETSRLTTNWVHLGRREHGRSSEVRIGGEEAWSTAKHRGKLRAMFLLFYVNDL